MNPTSQTLHCFRGAHRARKVNALRSHSIRSRETHPPQKGSESLITFVKCVLVSLTMAATACSSGPQPTGTRPVAPSVDLCADKLPPGACGPTNGKLVATINTGRILVGIEAAGAGTIALAYIDAGGLHVVPMAHDGTLAHPAWAPEGTIVFDSERAGGRHLFQIATDGSGLTQVTREAGSAEQDVSFSPDGGRIAYAQYSCVEERDFGIQVAAADGSNPVALNQPFPLHSVAGEGDAAFSPDGKSVAFVRSVDDSHRAVWVVPAAGGKARRLTSDDLGAVYPRWSSDGTHERTLWVGNQSTAETPHWGP